MRWRVFLEVKMTNHENLFEEVAVNPKKHIIAQVAAYWRKNLLKFL